MKPARLENITIILAVYSVLPFLFISAAENADNHFVKTLRTVETRQGHYVEIDRAEYMNEGQRTFLKTFAREKIEVEGIREIGPKSVSIQGKFVSTDRIEILNYHFHNSTFRDLASYAGILLIAIYFTGAKLKNFF